MNQAFIAPMSFRKSNAFFGIPWLMMVISIYGVLPALARARIALFASFLIALGIPLGLLILAALIAYQHDGGTWTWAAFRRRLRLEPMRGTAWAWTAGLSVLMVLAPAFLGFTAAWIQKFAPIPQPLARMFEITPDAFMGMPLSGAWWLAGGYLVYLLTNVLGEELWWRGTIFPRQELCFGKWTWLVHGILWNLFHTFFYWEIITLLPGCLALSYVAQKTRNTWPGIIAHLANGISGLVMIVIGVLR